MTSASSARIRSSLPRLAWRDVKTMAAIRRAHADLGVVLEPAGAAALAAVFVHPDRFRGRLVVAILSGGNATSDQMRQWLAP